ncbi:MAG: sulfite exporter TauE/SafE family protein, partial [Methanomassiliicoccales archaeon]|nr:sulfite exporter TauE/SafE family protein [Methanomassiliicoccales archaeon]
GYPMQEAIGASLVAVMSTSVGSASRYVGQRVSNVRLGLMLGTVTSLGGLVGALVAVYLDQYILAALFALMLLYTAFYMLRDRESETICTPGTCGGFDLSCAYAEGERTVEYGARNLGKGMAGSLVGGVQSGMLGVGGGVVNVPVMRLWMGVPLRAACATSNYMIGITALAGAIVYYQFGLIQALLAAVVAIGVFLGAVAGSRLSYRVQGRTLKLVFSVVLVSVAALMALKAVGVMP